MSDDSDNASLAASSGLNGSGRRNWDESFEALIAYKKKFGNVLVPSSFGDDTALGHWVRKQRRNEANNKISGAKRDKLESIGFVWKLRGDQATPASEKTPPKKRNWQGSFEALVAYKKKRGHVNVPRRNPGDFALGQWVSKQRLHQDDLSRRQKDKLRAIGFDFECKREKNQRAWDEMFERLKIYKERNGDAPIPYNYERDPGLGPWVSEQRSSFLEDRLSQERTEKLESLGIVLEGSEDQAKALSPRGDSMSLAAKWKSNYKILQQFYQEHGHCIVSRNHDKPLSYWVVRQRQLNFIQKLKTERKELLDQLNFEWYMGNSERPEHYFDEMIGRLADYQQQYGTVDVPFSYARGGLGEWVDGLKEQARKGYLEPEQAARLLRVGFTWLEDRDRWMKNLREVSYEVKGRRRDPTELPSFSPDVETWLRVQFMLADYDLLPPKRQARLESLGLTWNGSELSCEDRDDRDGDTEVGNAWLVDELSAGFDLKDAALSWTPEKSKKNSRGQRTAPVAKKDVGNSPSPPNNIVQDAESPSSSFGDAQDVQTPPKDGVHQASPMMADVQDDSSSAAKEDATEKETSPNDDDKSADVTATSMEDDDKTPAATVPDDDDDANDTSTVGTKRFGAQTSETATVEKHEEEPMLKRPKMDEFATTTSSSIEEANESAEHGEIFYDSRS